jgi:hypothetical protein
MSSKKILNEIIKIPTLWDITKALIEGRVKKGVESKKEKTKKASKLKKMVSEMNDI